MHDINRVLRTRRSESVTLGQILATPIWKEFLDPNKGCDVLRRRQLAGSGLVAIAAMIISTVPAGAVDGNLPGGTAISVDITSPAEDTVFPQGPVTVNGTASIGKEERPRSAFGLRSNDNHAYSVGADYVPRDAVSLGLSYTYEKYDALLSPPAAATAAHWPSENAAPTPTVCA